MEMMMVICDRKLTKNVIKILNESDIKYHVSFYGNGTADNEVLSYFGLAKSEKEIIISFVDKVKTEAAMEQLNQYKYIKQHGAVALCVPMDLISKSAQDYILKIGG